MRAMVLVSLVAVPQVAYAFGAAFEAEAGFRVGSVTDSSDAAACGGTVLSAPTADNRTVYRLEIQNAAFYSLWIRVKVPVGAARAILLTLDSLPPGTFSDPEDRFDITGTVDDFVWLRATRRGSGTAQNPSEDPLLFDMDAATHDLEMSLRDADVLVDRLVLTSRLDYLPTACDPYQEPPQGDGAVGGDPGVSGGGDDDRIHGAIAAHCADDAYYDLTAERCRAYPSSGCGAAPGGVWALLLLGLWRIYEQRPR